MNIDTTRYFEAVQQAASALRQRGVGDASVAIVLGSGLGDFADGFKGATTIPYAEIPNWPGTTVIGHAGRLVVGAHKGRTVIALSGRAHYYEGHAMQTVTFATRVIGTLGAKTVILTNAAGGINRDLTP